MTTKRNKGVSSLDLALPVAPYYLTDPQVLKGIEAMRTNAVSRWAKDDYSRALSGFHNTDDNPSKIALLAQPKVELLRANSPTLKRLSAARVKLERYANTILRNISTGRQSARSTRGTPYPKIHEKQSSVVSQTIYAPPQSQPLPPPPPPPGKQIMCQSSLGNGPQDKITYEKTQSLNGNMKQKCSLEIWLPKPSLDDDENTSRTATPEVNIIEKKPQLIPTIKSRRSSITKITATTTITNIETKSLDEVSSKKSESVAIPHAYHYRDYVLDLPDERPRSSKSVTTIKSDSIASIKSIRRQHTRPHTRRQSIATNHSDEILRFGTIEVSTSAKTVSVNTKSTATNREIKTIVKPTNPSMISELMQKYSLIKKSDHELTQGKFQLEKPNTDSKNNSNTTKDSSPRSRPPPVPESTSLVPSDQPTISVRKLLIDTLPKRSVTDQNHTNTKLLERRSTPHKPSHLDIYPQLRIFSLVNQQQHRQSSAFVSAAALLPNVSGKKTDDTARTLQRSKTLDVVLDIPSSGKVKSRVPIQLDNLLQRTTNGTVEQIPSRTSKRPGLNSASIVRNSKQQFHRSSTSTSIRTNTVLIHFNNGDRDRSYLVPE